MANLSQLRTDLQTRFQDKNGGFLSTVPANLYINMACEDFVNDVQPMSREYGYYITQYKFRYDLPTDYIHSRAMMWYYNGQDVEIPYRSPQEFKRAGLMMKRAPSSTPEAYTIIDDDLYLGPAPVGSGNTTTMSANMNSSATSLVVADSSQMHSQAGIVLIENEQIAHQSNDTSTDTLGLLLRGQGGTTAAAHDGSVTPLTVSRCDLVMTYAYQHTYMTSDTQSPAFSSRYHRLIIMLALYYALKQSGMEDEATAALDMYDRLKGQARREVRRQVRDISNRRISTAYD